MKVISTRADPLASKRRLSAMDDDAVHKMPRTDTRPSGLAGITSCPVVSLSPRPSAGGCPVLRSTSVGDTSPASQAEADLHAAVRAASLPFTCSLSLGTVLASLCCAQPGLGWLLCALNAINEMQAA